MSKNNILIIYNPGAQGGKAEKVKDAYVHHIQSYRAQYWVTETSKNRKIPQLEDLLLNTIDVISIIGGDGTLNLVLNVLRNFHIPLHIIPAGSGNDFAKSLYPDIDIKAIFNLPFADNTLNKEVDLWNCNQLKFINAFGVGFDGSIVNKMKGKKYWYPSKMKYWVEILRHLLFYVSNEYEINGKKQKAFMLTFANGKIFGGGFKIAPKAKIADQKIDFVIVKKLWIPLRPFYLPLLQMGKHTRLNVIEYSQTNEIVIKSERSTYGQIDGEPLIEKNYHIKYDRKIPFLNKSI